MLIHRVGSQPCAVVGLWERWRKDDGEALEYGVSRQVNSPRNGGPKLVEAVEREPG